jgi:hypothetical protein
MAVSDTVVGLSTTVVGTLGSVPPPPHPIWRRLRASSRAPLSVRRLESMGMRGHQSGRGEVLVAISGLSARPVGVAAALHTDVVLFNLEIYLVMLQSLESFHIT